MCTYIQHNDIANIGCHIHVLCAFIVHIMLLLCHYAGDNSEASGGREQDLNTVSEQALALTKEKMDSTFQMNCVQPGEEGWQYDKQHMFGPPCMESGWDSDSSSTQEF